MAKNKTGKLKEVKTWQGKLRETHAGHGKIVEVPPIWQKRFGNSGMLIAEPLKIDAMVRKIRKGQLMAQSQLGKLVAGEAGAGACCPMTLGIFLRIVAEASEEARGEGRKRITPWWRVVKDDGKLNEKFPGGAKCQAKLLREEGHTISPGKGKQPPKVKGWQASD
jgi:alkylated DNA nucleotide flippase Atl1